jgi:hypothetical protein
MIVDVNMKVVKPSRWGDFYIAGISFIFVEMLKVRLINGGDSYWRRINRFT